MAQSFFLTEMIVGYRVFETVYSFQKYIIYYIYKYSIEDGDG